MEILKSNTKKKSKFENLVVNLALQKVNSDRFEYDGKAVYTADMNTLIYHLLNEPTIAIPEGVRTIGAMALTQHDKLQTVTLPPTVEKIERDAFSECDSLEAITIPASVKGVYGFAFAECDVLKEVTFEGVPEHLGRRTFSGCENLRTLCVPQGSADYFRKELHLDEDPDILVVEKEERKEAKADTTKATETASKPVETEPNTKA